MKKLTPTVNDYGGSPAAEHNMPCAVFNGVYKEAYSAVINLNTGVFHPSWRAQQSGYRLVKCKHKWQLFILRLIGVSD